MVFCFYFIFFFLLVNINLIVGGNINLITMNAMLIASNEINISNKIDSNKYLLFTIIYCNLTPLAGSSKLLSCVY